MNSPDLRYPIGKFQKEIELTETRREELIYGLASLPANLRRVVQPLSQQRLDTPYRPGGWTVRQVVHHLPDSHMNAYVRFKLTLTEETPPLKPYEEQIWAELVDGKTGDPSISLGILDGVHNRLHRLLQTLGPADFARRAHHPQHGQVTLDWLLQLYAWHGKHHIGHLALAKQR
jgi:DinB superfamily